MVKTINVGKPLNINSEHFTYIIIMLFYTLKDIFQIQWFSANIWFDPSRRTITNFWTIYALVGGYDLYLIIRLNNLEFASPDCNNTKLIERVQNPKLCRFLSRRKSITLGVIITKLSWKFLISVVPSWTDGYKVRLIYIS